MRRRPATYAGVASVGVLSMAQFVALVVHLVSGGGAAPLADASDVPGLLSGPVPEERTVEVYAGQGAWVDVYDYAPAVQTHGREPPLTADDIEDMADLGVRTVYLQAAHEHAATPGALVDPELIGEFLTRAHEEGVRVVGWYLPRFVDVESDLEHLAAIADFEVEGNRFDGVAVDIEWTRSVPDHRARSERLIELSERLADVTGDDALGAIVLPPLQTEVINPALWPDFPWAELAQLYDAWLPMSYWTARRPESGYRDGYVYTEENVRRLRINLGDEDAVVHPIGGIGDDATGEDLSRFVESLGDTDAVGGSIYDWQALAPDKREQFAAAMAD